MKNSLKASKHNFTLTELLVVIAILAILMSLLSPALRSAMYQAKNVKCASNLKNLTIGQTMYCDDNYGFYSNQNDTTYDPASSRNQSRKGFMGKSTDGGGRWDIRDGLRPYFGGECGPNFVCPFNTENRMGNGSTGIDNSSFGGRLNGGAYMTYSIFAHRPGKVGPDAARFDRDTTLDKKYYKSGSWGSSRGTFESDLMWGDVVNINERSAYYREPATVTSWETNGFARQGLPPSLHISPDGIQPIIQSRDLSYFNRRDWHGGFQAEGNFSYKDGSVDMISFNFMNIDIEWGVLALHDSPDQIFPVDK